ncbi:hypothetical protein ACLB2K_040028 [Fragaria x ananassa]
MQGLSSSFHNLSTKERTTSEGRPGAPAFDPPMPKLSALGWGLSQRGGPLPWRVSPRLAGDCRYVASQCALDWRLSRLSVAGRCVASQFTLGWGLSQRGGPLPWRVSPRLAGDCRYVASQCALDWRLSLLSVAGRCVASQSALGWGLSQRGGPLPWRVRPRLAGDCRYVASQCALDWRLSRLSVAGRCVASQSALGWGLSQHGGPLPWRVSPRLAGDCRYVCALDWRLSRLSVAGRCVASQSALGWGLSQRGGPLLWRVSPRLAGDCRYVGFGGSTNLILGSVPLHPRSSGRERLAVCNQLHCYYADPLFHGMNWGRSLSLDLYVVDGMVRMFVMLAENLSYSHCRQLGAARGLARLVESARNGEVSGVREDWLDQRSPLGGGSSTM